MGTKHVFCMRASDEEGTPWIDTPLPENSGRNIPWGEIGQILSGKAPLCDYKPVYLTVHEDGWQNWHYYPVAGTFGLFSQTLIDLIGAHMKKCFQPCLKAFVNDLPYHFLRQIDSLDCLDRKHSELVPFPHDPQRVMRIKRYAFLKDKIPDAVVFVIPEALTEMFATLSIKKMVEDVRLNGLIFIDAEKVGAGTKGSG